MFIDENTFFKISSNHTPISLKVSAQNPPSLLAHGEVPPPPPSPIVPTQVPTPVGAYRSMKCIF